VQNTYDARDWWEPREETEEEECNVVAVAAAGVVVVAAAAGVIVVEKEYGVINREWVFSTLCIDQRSESSTASFLPASKSNSQNAEP
jgi:hypothetical protein